MEAANSHCLGFARIRQRWRISNANELKTCAEEVCYLWEDIEISNIEQGRALNSWLIGL